MKKPAKVFGENHPTRVLLLYLAITAGLIFAGLYLLFVVTLPVLEIGKPFRVPNNAMSPSIHAGDQIYALRWDLLEDQPHRGDVMIFKPDGIVELQNKKPISEWYMKRIAGLPDETVSIRDDGQFCVNGKPAAELTGTSYGFGDEFLTYDGDTYIVPTRSYFLLGDNSPSSWDSRYWGCVPLANIRYRAVFRFWPLTRFGWIK
jgi:signal peptidase I